ncbi:MAG: energy transducer TonB [Candidatus Omnitrophica bacterium]|nr:energy transducer TonB [Candidatus Omnitrophota bacterium]
MRRVLFFSLFVLSMSIANLAFGQESTHLIEQTASEKPKAQSVVPVTQNSNKVSLDIKGMDITDVLKMLATRSGYNIVIGKNVSGRVTLFLKDVDVQDAFEIILLANELAYDQKGKIINVMTQRDYELIYGERFQDKKQAKVIRLLYAKAADLSRALNQIKTNIGRVVVDEGSNTLVLIDSPVAVKSMEEFIKKTDLPLQTRIYSLNYAAAEKIQPKLQEIITKGVGSVRIDERTNKIVVTDYPQKLDEISKIILAFDEKTPQVLIDAQIVEINPKKDQFTMGVDWDYWLRKNARFAGNLPAPSITDVTVIPNKFSFGLAAANALISGPGQYKAMIEMLRVIGETKILSSPRIMALNNQEAKILVGSRQAYITSTTTVTQSNPVTTQQVNFVDVGLKLYVTPTINRDGFVTMKIRPEISTAKMTDITSDGKVTQVPIVTTSETETTIMVKDNTTIIIAGMKKDQLNKEVKKIPFIGDIPLIGYAFRNTKDEVIKTELVIFLTPRIVSGEETIEYTSSTHDKDIVQIQEIAKANNKLDKPWQQASKGEYYLQLTEKINKFAKLNQAGGKKGEVSLKFVVLKDGKLAGEPRVIQSTDDALSPLAIKALKDAAPFAPLPEDTQVQEEAFRISINYN